MKSIKSSIIATVIFFFLTITGVQAHNTISVEFDLDIYRDYLYAVYSDGTLYRFNSNKYDPLKIDRVKILDDVTDVSRNFALKEDGTVWTWKNDDLTPIFITDSVINISCGSSQSAGSFEVKTLLMLKNNGELWGYGYNGHGQLAQTVNEGEGTNFVNDPIKIMDNVIAMDTGTGHTIILKNDGSVWTVGNNEYGQLGNGSFESSNVPYKVMDNAKAVFASGSASFAVDDNNIVYRWGTNYIDHIGNIDNYKFTTPIRYATDMRYIENVPEYNFVIKNNDSLWIYGESTESELFRVSRKKSIQIPVQLCENIDSFAAADGDVFCSTIALLNEKGQLNILKFNSDYSKDGDPIYNLYPISNNVRLSTDEPIKVNFSDIDAISDTEKNAVNKLAKAGIINGITETEFMPDKEITRAETAALLLRMTGKADETGEASFSDVSANDWYYSIAGASQKYGIINGYEDNTFRGNETVSELQLVSLAARTLRNEGTAVEPEETKTLGAGIVPDWAYEDIEYALNHEIITEAEASNSSDKPVTRGEAAVILYRLYNVV